MRKTHRVLLGVGLAALVLLASCSQPGASSTPPSPAQAKTISANVVAAVGQALSGVKSLSGAKGLASQTTYNGSYSGTGYNVSYTATNPNSGGGISATVTITFNGYSYNGVTFSSGSAVLTLVTDSAGDENIVYTGNFNITYSGTAYTFGWNLTYNLTVSPYAVTYSGTYTIDGQSYTYTG